MDPADRFLFVQEVHGGGLLGAGEGQAVGIGSRQGRGLDVLGISDEEDGRTVDWDYKRDGRRRIIVFKKQKRHKEWKEGGKNSKADEG